MKRRIKCSSVGRASDLYLQVGGSNPSALFFSLTLLSKKKEITVEND